MEFSEAQTFAKAEQSPLIQSSLFQYQKKTYLSIYLQNSQNFFWDLH